MATKELDLRIVKKQTDGMEAMVAQFEVKDENSLKLVADKIKEVKTIKKFVEQEKDKFVSPAKAIISEAKDKYDPFIKKCEEAELVLKRTAKVYMDAVDAQRKIDEKKIADKVESGYIKPETAVKKIEALPETPSTVRTDNNSGLRMSKRKVAKIVNPELIPDEYWTIDEVRVRREALEREKNGLPQIPGVEITEESSLSSI